ncbi:host specificity factor TipJ family phage tail protein [Acinetobacter sp. NIPH 1852]|uniref:host specificity factor TipJ family phage tail protein n=1 Tax=Acinetobacter sp. NIPH 1852 TaxID=2923428 RepID=UPI001F4B2330|nr:host specificity factor TipJ family phage tail protein [Acinetobacter sp. NIPH 1852]MCH7307556.1 host specificity factor TipJ family phage tail protein [Acinetobacter sp. NIPH 1852]
MSHLQIYEDPLDASTITYEQTDNVLKRFLEIKAKFTQARIYKDTCCTENDVTPIDKVTALKLLDAGPEDQFHIVCHAGDIISAVNYVVVKILGYAVNAFVNVPTLSSNAQDKGSSNNELTSRENKQRIGQRVADIYGKVKSIPDLIAPSFVYYINKQEIEESLMCLGRGYYHIQDIKDGDTTLSTISGSACSIYEPDTSIIGTPQIQIGEDFTDNPLVAKSCTAINGQTVNEGTEDITNSDVDFQLTALYPNRLQSLNSSVDMRDYFQIGNSILLSMDTVGVADLSVSANCVPKSTGELHIQTTEVLHNLNYKSLLITSLMLDDLNLAGNYQISSIAQVVDGYICNLVNPENVNSNWSLIVDLDEKSAFFSGILQNNADSIDLGGEYPSILDVGINYIDLEVPTALQLEWDKLQSITLGQVDMDIKKIVSSWLGWFYIDYNDIKELIFNFYLPQGLQVIRKKGQRHTDIVDYTIEYQEISNGLPTGPVFTHTHRVQDNTTVGFGVSSRIPLASTFADGVRFRVKKAPEQWRNEVQQRLRDLKLKSVYACSVSNKLIYNDVTIVRTKTIGTNEATSVKNRMLNCIATRKLFTYRTGFKSVARIPTSNFADIVCAITTDELIGRRDISTLDVANLYAVADEIDSYFGVPIQFNYTFDDAKMSYEETLTTIANAVFCDARRESNKVFFVFEKPQQVPTLLFNHRNKKPESEKRSVNFGVNKDYDGVKLKWVDPTDSWSESEIKLPNDNVVNARELEIKGITNLQQAMLLAHRALNKLLYQKKTVEFSAYSEADLVTRNDLILVADDTRPMLISSGSVIDQDGLYLTLSQPCVLEQDESYVVHLQLPNGQVDVVQVTQGDSEREVLLARAPTSQLVIEYEGNISCSTYLVTTDTHSKRDLFLITEKSGGGAESSITAINYTDQYYLNDKDYV